MAVDPRLESLPEHEGPAFRTWQLIMQTTMGSVVQQQQPGIQYNEGIKTKNKFSPAEDFISLNNDQESNGNNELSDEKKKEANDESSSNKIFTPWKTIDHYPEDPVGLHMEISDFYQYMSPLPEEEAMRQNVVDRISALIMNIWPSAKVEVFGSFNTKLYLPTSDIDLAVFGKWEKLPLFTLEKELVNHDIAVASTIKVLDKASVPIIKLTDTKSKIRVDISFNIESSVESAEFIRKSIEEFKILPALFITVKHFLIQRDLNEVFTGGISSYCLMLLMISFLQNHPRIDVKKTSANLGVLLMEFFELYGRNFNYQKIAVKIRGNGSYAKKEKLAKELGEDTFLPLLCIEDPITLSCDIGKSSYGILRVKEAFEYAFNVIDIALRNKYYYKVNPNSTYLSRIISVPKDLCEYREWVKSSYQPSEFIPKTVYTTVTTPIFQVGAPTQYVSTNNGRPPLLPTPPSPFSPRVNIITPPFSPYPATTNYGHAFFEGSTIQPTIIIPNASEGADIVTTQISPLQLNPPTELGNTPQQVRYQVLPTYTHHKLNENRLQSFLPSSQIHSPIKTPTNVNNMNGQLSNVLTNMVQQQRRSMSFNSNKMNNGHSYYNNNKRGNTPRNSQRNSPRTSPKLNNREFNLAPVITDSFTRMNGGKPNELRALEARSQQHMKQSEISNTDSSSPSIIDNVQSNVDDVIVLSSDDSEC